MFKMPKKCIRTVVIENELSLPSPLGTRPDLIDHSDSFREPGSEPLHEKLKTLKGLQNANEIDCII